MVSNIIKLAQFIDLYHTIVKVSYIRKLPNGKYRVFSKDGKNLGTYTSKEKAEHRLKQIEYFKYLDKHNKKASSNMIDLSNLDTLSYSAIARELNKSANKEALVDFVAIFKECFDKSALENNDSPVDTALPEALLIFTKKHNIKLPRK